MMSPLFEHFVLRGETVIAAADVLRWACLVMGLAVAALYVRAFLQGRHHEEWLARYPGFRLRLGAIGVFTAFACLTQYERLNDPVSVLLPMALLGLGMALAGIYLLPYKPEPEREQWLRGDDA